ncbi:regulatory protein GemA [bacterium]|nr:regulatory protein GemA [bacterium]
MMSSPKQRQTIGYLRKVLSLDEDTYREILANYCVESSTQLTYEQANELLDSLKTKAVSLGLYVKRSDKYFSKYSNMSGRFGMATPKQLRKIDVMWKQVSTQPTDEAKERALNRFILRITGKQRLNFLTQEDVSKVIKAIETMQEKASELL